MFLVTAGNKDAAYTITRRQISWNRWISRMTIAGRIILAYSKISIAPFGSKSSSPREAVGLHRKSMQSWHRCSSRTRFHEHSRNPYTNYIWMTKLGCHDKFIDVIKQFCKSIHDQVLKDGDDKGICWDLLYQVCLWWHAVRRLKKIQLLNWWRYLHSEDNYVARCNPRFHIQW